MFARLSSRSRKRFVSPLLVVLYLVTCRSSLRNTRLRLVAFGGEPPRASVWGMRVRLFSFPFREIATSLSFLAMTTRHKHPAVSHCMQAGRLGCFWFYFSRRKISYSRSEQQRPRIVCIVIPTGAIFDRTQRTTLMLQSKHTERNTTIPSG